MGRDFAALLFERAAEILEQKCGFGRCTGNDGYGVVDVGGSRQASGGHGKQQQQGNSLQGCVTFTIPSRSPRRMNSRQLPGIGTELAVAWLYLRTTSWA